MVTKKKKKKKGCITRKTQYGHDYVKQSVAEKKRLFKNCVKTKDKADYIRHRVERKNTQKGIKEAKAIS